MSKQRRTFSGGDPQNPNTPAPSSSASRRRLENRSSENSNSTATSSSDPNPIDLSLFSNMTSPGTTVTEPDRSVEVPTLLESEATLHFFGLNEKRSQEIWKKWTSVNQDNYYYDFGHFARTYLRKLVDYENCDTGEPGVDWRPSLEKIGANASLSNAIAGKANDDHGVRLTKSAAEWVEKAIQWRWAWLLYIHNASKIRSDGGLKLPPPTDTNMLQVRALTSMQVGEEDVTELIYDRKTNSATMKSGQSPDYVPFWRGACRTDAEAMWSGPMRTGTFDISNQRDPAPTDFSGLRAVHYWTPDMQGAQKYSDYCKKIADPAGVCLIRIEVPKALLEKQKAHTLRFPGEDFKRMIYFSRNSKDVEPKALMKVIMKSNFLIGDTTSGINRKYVRIKDWTSVSEKNLQMLKSGEIMTQFVFGHITGDDLEDDMNKLDKVTTIRDAEHPRILLPPLETEALPGNA